MRMETLQIEIREKALSEARWRHIQQDLNQSVSLAQCSINIIGLLD